MVRSMTNPDSPIEIGFLLTPELAMLAFGSAVEPYRAANVTSGKELYRWTFLSDDGKPITAGNGITLTPDQKPDIRDRFDRIFVCGGVATQLHKPENSIRWLQQQAQNGTCIGSVSTGAWLLAHANLLQGNRCTIHWQSIDAFKEAFPDIKADPFVYVIDNNRCTCCGGTGAFDMMVHLIAEDYGDDVVTNVCNWLFHDRVRMATDVQGVAHQTALARKSPKLAAAFRVMSNHIEDRLTPGEIAAQIGVSQRQLERLFQRHMQCTPQQKYMDLRLQHAKRLLMETSLPILDISIAAGFTSQSHFTKCYRERFHRTPRSERVGHSDSSMASS